MRTQDVTWLAALALFAMLSGLDASIPSKSAADPAQATASPRGPDVMCVRAGLHFEANRGQYPDDATIVAHCTIGYRSGKYVAKLQRQGLDALNLKGSILSWVHAGQPVVTFEGEETKRVHVYGQKWDLLPQGYKAVW